MAPVKLMPMAPPELVQRLAYHFWQQREQPWGTPEVDWFRAEEFLREQILALRPKAIVCGVDDFATGRALTSGWAYFALPEHAIPEFAKRARALLAPTGLDEFHASENFRDAPTAFAEFLELIRETAQSNWYSLICASSSSHGWANDMASFAERVVETSFQHAGVSDAATITACKACAPPLFTAPRILEDFGDTIELRLEVDQDDTSAPFTSLSTTVQGTTFTARRLFAVALDSYCARMFPHSPRPKRDGSSITLLESEKSFMVQASDVIGNFAMNFAFRDIGPTTAGRTQKAQMFENVFGPSFSGLGPKHSFSTVGDEIAPMQSGVVEFTIRNLPELSLSF